MFVPTDGAGQVGRPCRVAGRSPRAELAVIRHHGSPHDIDLTYGELGAYVMQHAIGVDGPLRESYLTGYIDTADTDEWDTEIGWPIFRTGE